MSVKDFSASLFVCIKIYLGVLYTVVWSTVILLYTSPNIELSGIKFFSSLPTELITTGWLVFILASILGVGAPKEKIYETPGLSVFVKYSSNVVLVSFISLEVFSNIYKPSS